MDKSIYDMDRDELLAEIKRLNTKLDRVIGEAQRLESRYTDGHEILLELGVPLEPKNEEMTMAKKLRWLRSTFPVEIGKLIEALFEHNSEYKSTISYHAWHEKNQKNWWDIS